MKTTMNEQELKQASKWVRHLAHRIAPILTDQDFQDRLMALSSCIAMVIADAKDLTSEECWAIDRRLLKVIDEELREDISDDN
jgi:hypothetical protein